MTPNLRRPHRCKGFGAVELVIVVIILGMVFLFALKGAAIIPQVRAIMIAQQISQYRAAVQQYQIDHRSLPGDDLGAVQRWPRPDALFNVSGALVSFAGDGKMNGLLDDPSNTLGEQYAAWRDLRFGGYIGGDPTLVGQSARPETLADITYGFAEDNLGIPQALCLTRVPGRDAELLDKKLDDGVINTGILRGTSKWDPVGTNNHFSEPDTVAYDPDKTYIICLPMLP